MTWLVFTPQDITTARALDRDLGNRLDAHLAEHDVMTSWICVPSDRMPPDATPPQGARTVFIIDEPTAELADDPVAVSMLRMLLERSNALAIDWGDVDYGGGETQTARDALALLASEDYDKDLYQAMPGAPANQGSKGASAGQNLSERVLESFNAALEDMERGIELKEALEEASEPARLWLEHVVRNNAPEDSAVDAALKLPPERAARIHREVEALLSDLWK